MEQPKHLTQNLFHVPMCEWCLSFKSLRTPDNPKCRFGKCTNTLSLKCDKTIPISLHGCRYFVADTPGIAPLSKRKKDIQDIEELENNNDNNNNND